MLFRALAYIVFGWILLAAVPGLGHAFGITLMLPATSAVLVTHLAFSREGSLPWGLAVATALGYLEDLHQGAPVGTLSLVYAITFMGLRWSAARIALHQWYTRLLAALVAVSLIDMLTWGVLILLSTPLGIDRNALHHSLWMSRWHILATGLVAHPVWMLMDGIIRVTRLDQLRPAAESKPPPHNRLPLSLDKPRPTGVAPRFRRRSQR